MKRKLASMIVLVLMGIGSFAIAADTDTAIESTEFNCSCC